MKSGYGKRKKHEEESLVSHEESAGAAKDTVKNSSSRKIVAGALAVLLGVGAACAYVTFPSESTIASVPVEAMESQSAYTIPSDDENSGSSGLGGYIPAFSDFDTNGDGIVSTVEYTAHLAKLRDDALARVAASDLPQTEKYYISDRLNKNFIKESTCATNLANRDTKNAGNMSQDVFDVFYSMISEFCAVEDITIPAEYNPVETPPPAKSSSGSSGHGSEVSTTGSSSASTGSGSGSEASTTGSRSASTGSGSLPSGSEASTTGSPSASTGSGSLPSGSEASTTGSPSASTGSGSLPSGSEASTIGSSSASTGSGSLPSGSVASTIGSSSASTGSVSSSSGVSSGSGSNVMPSPYGPFDTLSMDSGSGSTFTSPDLAVYSYLPIKLTEGQSIKCDPSKEDVFRFTGGKRRWYPTVQIATSWDLHWDDFDVVNCTAINRGPDMDMFAVPACHLSEGQSIKCSSSEPEVYRFTGGQRRWYPSPDIALSWDSNWENFVIADCSTISQGDDMPFNQPVLTEGETVTCAPGSPAMYRFTNNTVRYYPSHVIAMSWLAVWETRVPINCAILTRGPDMTLKLPPPSILAEGQAMKCDSALPEVYRFTCGQRRWYPTPKVATSWDSDWKNFTVVDCSSLPQGDDMPMHLPAFKDLYEGETIKCDGKNGVFRFTSGQLRLYEAPDVAASWSIDLQNFTVVDCSSIPRGDDMPYFQPILIDGQSVKCNADDSAVYRYSNNTLQLYPSSDIAASWDPTWNDAVVISCFTYTYGPQMKIKLPSPSILVDGQSMKCDPNATEVYRFASGQRRWYPTEAIATSWDPSWGNCVAVDCSSLTQGPDMTFFAVSPSSLTDGQAIKCDPNQPQVFRYSGGQRRWYPNPTIASSWDPNWSNFVFADCSQIQSGDDMPFNKLFILDGQAVKCDAFDSAIYRFANNSIRLYPNSTIAESWDPSWESAIVIDCSVYGHGLDMSLKLPSPAILHEGQAIKCDPNDAAVYRFTGGVRRWYPNPVIASSWDPNWANFVLVDCSALPQGNDMTFNQPIVSDGDWVKCSSDDVMFYRFTNNTIRFCSSQVIAKSWSAPSGNVPLVNCSLFSRGLDLKIKLPPIDGDVVEGQAIKCDLDRPEVYRFTGGLRRWYPNPTIASSWDPSWQKFIAVDCSSFPQGDDMALNIPVLSYGQAVKCNADEPNIYCFMNGSIHWYPNPTIASSWDSKWSSPILINCSYFPHGPDMTIKLPSPGNLTEGHAIKCDPSRPEVYRYTGGIRRWYPNPAIASSWDAHWGDFVAVDCSSLPQGPDMVFNQPIISEGQAVKCNADEPNIYRFTNGSIRWYPNPAVAASWDSNWASPILIDCSTFSRGVDMIIKLPPPPSVDGQAIKCDPNRPEVYRYTGGIRRWYPNPTIASSWDANWGNFIAVDCSLIPQGPDMQFNQPIISEGQAVKCNADEPNIYRFTNGSIRWYPNPAVAASWDPNWASPILIDCSTFSRGVDMIIKLPPPPSVDGQAIKCDPNRPEVYRYTGGIRRWYPNPTIASSWDANWGNFIAVDCSLIPQGPDMQLKVPIISEGQAVKCNANEAAIYRYANGTYRLYPNPDIAASWDSNWASPILIDCSSFSRGQDMATKLPAPTNLVEGQPIKCNPADPAIYRYTGGERRWYPNPTIAASWDPNWAKFIVVDCSAIPRDDDMELFKLAYSKLTDGQPIKCTLQRPEVYRYACGGYRWYPNENVAASWDPNWKSWTLVDCDPLERGMDMWYRQPIIPEGQAVKCNTADAAIFRFTNKTIRWYPNPTIAASWDPSWSSPAIVNCTSFPRVADMALKSSSPIIIPEGQAIKCDLNRPEVYRFTGGMRRWYPNPTIASSWDPTWGSFITVDCSSVPQGPDMKPNQPIIPEGQAVKCNADEPNIYRFTNGSIRWYPNPAVAASWDPKWSSPILIDCSYFARGVDMTTKLPPPIILGEGQAMKCDPNRPEVYRFTDNMRRWYPNPTIASSWDPNWGNFVAVDCSSLPQGPDMKFNQPIIAEGQAVKCNANDPAIYRYTNGSIRWYPNPTIAASWDSKWASPIVIDCSSIPHGLDLSVKLPPPSVEGQAIKCDLNRPEVYRFTGGMRRWYPNPTIASSWDPTWGSFITVDCSSVPQGPDMKFNQPIISEGQAVKCNADEPNIYRFTNGSIRWYPNPAVAASWDPKWASPILIDCSYFARGLNMAIKYPSPNILDEGQAMKCDSNRPEVYRYACGQRRWYPNPTIASSWDPNWGNFVVVDCSSLPQGPDMNFNMPIIPDGQAVKCNANEPAIYRFMNGTIRLYPNPEIAASWDSKWASPILIDCSYIPHGKDLSIKLPPPAVLSEGHAMKCDPSLPEVYRYTGGQRRWYPNPTIASSWDPNWDNFIAVECSSLPQGLDMQFNMPILSDGQAIKCSPNEPAIYRFTNKTIQLYPNPDIAASWDRNYSSAIVVNCAYFSRGDDMKMKLQPWSILTSGQAFKCDSSANSVYRFSSGQGRLYPSPAIASSWDPTWTTCVVVDCSYLTVGDDMALKPPVVPSTVIPDGWTKLDGALVQLSFDGKWLCGVNSADDIWCASENIRGEGPTRWIQLPGKLIHVVVYGESLFGVNRANQIFYGSLTSGVKGSANWQLLPGALKQITTDNKQICGVNANDDIFCADRNIRSNPNWRQIAGKLSYVELLNGRLVGANSVGNIFTGYAHGADASWFQPQGNLRQVSYDGLRMCGTNSVNDVWCADNNLKTSPNWSMSSGSMRHVSFNSGSIYGVDQTGNIFYRSM